MALFGFLKPPKPVGFDYKPRFYDPKKEEFQERLRKAHELAGDDPEALKARIRRNLQRKSSYLANSQLRQRQVMKSNLRLLVIIIVLIALTFAVIEIYLPRILQILE
jgi:uncharacterized membrane protein (DUF106 family)